VSFDWRKYLELAQSLCADREASEASLRAGISRAYYAAFHVCRKHAGVPTDGPDSHARVWNKMSESPDRVEKSIGASGDRIKGMRKKADYDPHARIDRRTAQTAIEEAVSLIAKIDRLRASRMLN